MSEHETHQPDPWTSALVLEGSLSVLFAMIFVFLWGVTGCGYFWPMWICFAFAIPIVVQVAVRLALRAPAGRWRALALNAAAAGSIAFIVVTIYLLSDPGGSFWPMWPLAVLALELGTHAIVTVSLPKLGRRERALEARVDELTRTRRGALDVQAAELRRIERDLHDGAQARLVALSMQLGRAEERLEDRPEVAELVRSAREEASAAIGELRDLARGIAPPVLADRGLEAAVEAVGRRSPMEVTVNVVLPRRPPPVVETAAYFVVTEALTNAAKHAGGAPATVTIVESDGGLVVEVRDEGRGGANPRGTGISGLRHRVEALDGSLAVTSPQGEGTTIRAELPCEW